MRKILGKKRRAASLANLTMGMTFGSFCSPTDVKNNVVDGSLDFVQGWAEHLWLEVIPTPGEILGGDEG